MLMEINPSTLIATIINFNILFVVLKYFFFEKVQAIIEERENLINEKLDYADEEAEKARMMAIEISKKLKKYMKK